MRDEGDEGDIRTQNRRDEKHRSDLIDRERTLLCGCGCSRLCSPVIVLRHNTRGEDGRSDLFHFGSYPSYPSERTAGRTLLGKVNTCGRNLTLSHTRCSVTTYPNRLHSHQFLVCRGRGVVLYKALSTRSLTLILRRESPCPHYTVLRSDRLIRYCNVADFSL